MERPELTRAVLRQGIVLALLLGLPAAAEAHHDLRLDAQGKGSKASFTIQFTAHLSERGAAPGRLDFYIADIRGPRGCREVSATTIAPTRAGAIAAMRLTPSAIKPFGKARQWCPGRYRGSVAFCFCTPGDPRPSVPVGSFQFLIPGPNSYAGRTTQREPIRFRLSRNGRRVQGLRVRLRQRCRNASGPYVGAGRAVLPTIELRRGRFRKTFRRKGGGGVLTISGRLTGGTFRGSFRARDSGPGFRCDTSKVSWTAR